MDDRGLRSDVTVRLIEQYFEHSVVIQAAPGRVLGAFFDSRALAIWWQAVRSVTIPRSFGVYAIEWEPTAFRDELLGPLGGVFYGTVIEFMPARGFLVSDAWWLPPDGEPIGPMALNVRCAMEGTACRLHVRQEGYEEGLRWTRYYDVISRGWRASLAALKIYLERGGDAGQDSRSSPTSRSDVPGAYWEMPD